MNKKKMLIASLAIALLVGIVSAGTILYFGQVKVTTTVTQAVLLDGKSYADMPITQEATVAGGESFCRPHWLESQTSVPVELQFETSFLPTLTSGEITVRYLKPVEYSFSTTVGTQPVKIDVTDDGTHITWTIDYPLEAPFEASEGNGLMTVGLVIALDGDGYGPAFQIHNNDGADDTFDWGTWLYSPWGPTITDGWFGWHSGDDNTLVTALDWVECSGGRYNEVNPDGLFTITIDKSELSDDFHWALNLAIGSGFYSNYLTYEQMSCPVGVTAYFDWTNPIVNDDMPNYVHATLTEEFTELILQPYEHLDFYICYSFDLLIEAGTYDIYTTIKP